nr:MAG TPA: hypothetical protein [Caudoviricetes sp.]
MAAQIIRMEDAAQRPPSSSVNRVSTYECNQ